MNILESITTGPQPRPHFMLIYGADGVGKSTLAAGAPNPIFIGSENLHTLNVARFPKPETLEDVRLQMGALISNEHAYDTLVIDSIDWLEPLVFQAVITEYKAKSIEDVDGGFGKGYIHALSHWKRLLKGIELLRDKGLNVILIGHALIKPFDDPDAGERYDRYLVKLNEKAAALIREAADEVLFINYETNTFAEKKGRKATATGDGSRVIYTERRPAFDAKNRHDLPFCIPVPNGVKGSKAWEILMSAFPNNNQEK